MIAKCTTLFEVRSFFVTLLPTALRSSLLRLRFVVASEQRWSSRNPSCNQIWEFEKFRRQLFAFYRFFA